MSNLESYQKLCPFNNADPINLNECLNHGCIFESALLEVVDHSPKEKREENIQSLIRNQGFEKCPLHDRVELNYKKGGTRIAFSSVAGSDNLTIKVS